MFCWIGRFFVSLYSLVGNYSTWTCWISPALSSSDYTSSNFRASFRDSKNRYSCAAVLLSQSCRNGPLKYTNSW